MHVCWNERTDYMHNRNTLVKFLVFVGLLKIFTQDRIL
ncbi:Uncharacterised protein [Chlamydia abortus]|nr:uncharacterized protein CHAB577_0361 [Chlamydia abortus]SGA33801.1 Uncharacterised protein [Chlamydia abortus]